MSWFRNQIAAALGTIRELAGEPVTYGTGAATISIDLAVRGAGDQVEDEENRITIQADDLDWLIKRDYLVYMGTPITPAEGHTITCADAGHAVTYAATPGPNNQCWEWSDAGHTQYRIHTKKIKVV